MSALTVGSLFAGVGGFDLGFERAGFEVRWQVEIDKDAVSVLERHWPTVTRYRDICEVDPSELAPVDVVTFGSPCQDFSVAGKRAGLEGERSGLFGEAVRIIRGLRPAFTVWENVPGALSSAGGRDFGAVLDALADCGAVDIAWRVLDARHFGVAQRRRRIFLVCDFGAERAGQVLFESASGSRHPAPGRTTGEGSPGDVERSTEGFSESGQGWWRDGIGTLRAEGENRPSRPSSVVMEPVAAEGGNRTSGPLDVATACNAHGGSHGRQDFESETFIVANSVQASAGHHGHSSPRGDGSDNLVPVAIRIGQQGANGHGFADDESHALDSGGPVQAVAITENVRAELRETAYANAIAGGGGKPGQGYQAVREGMAVRRLTPRECERLQGWPDDHTRFRGTGAEVNDGPRYRMIGNGVVAPVAFWIARRLRAVIEGRNPDAAV